MKHYWKILRKYYFYLLISPLLVLVTVISETVQPLFMSRIVDEGVMVHDLSVIGRVGIWMIMAALVGLLFNIVNVFVSSRVSIGFGTDLRKALFRRIERLSFSDVDRFGSASLITRLTNDIGRIQQVVLMSMRIMLRAPMMLVMALFFAVRIDTVLALVLLVSVPLLSLCVWLILRKGFPFFLQIQRKIDALNAVVRENLINIRVVKSFVREDFETRKFTANSEELRDRVIRASNILIALFPVMQLVLNISVAAVLWLGGTRVMAGGLQVGELIAFVNYLMQILMSLMMLSMVIMTVARASASSQRIVEVLVAEPSLTDTDTVLRNGRKIESGTVEFRDVYFRYAGGETDVLRKINFHIRAGETVAVVGATGSAKSSMVQLIPRLYDVAAGEVLVDGVNVKEYRLDELQRGVGMVLQQNELFSGTILENLRWGDTNASLEEVQLAARAAQAHDFVESFPEGYGTHLGRAGINLSGGQRQRLCIARALLRRPKILILDDSTSAVDSETELRIRKNIAGSRQDMTLIIITQRVNTMQSADRVIVLEDGEVEAVGTPGELLKISEVYREIYHSQQLTF